VTVDERLPADEPDDDFDDPYELFRGIHYDARCLAEAFASKREALAQLRRNADQRIANSGAEYAEVTDAELAKVWKTEKKRWRAENPTAQQIKESVEDAHAARRGALEPEVLASFDVNPGAEEMYWRDEDRAVARAARVAMEIAQNPLREAPAETLADRLAHGHEQRWRVEGFLGEGARLLLLAQRKTGKTTMVANLIRSLLTGDAFLGTLPVQALTGSVLFLNFEMSGPTLDAWLNDLDLPLDAQKRLFIKDLRGAPSPFATEAEQQKLSEEMRSLNVDFVVVDVFARAFGGEQNSNSEVAAFLGMLDRVVTAGGAQELALVAHAGWGNSERARGASALEDWADTIASLTMDEGGANPARYLRAFGRDVDIEKDRLDFDPATRRLTLTGAGGPGATRKAAKAVELAEPILAIVRRVPGVGVGTIEKELRDLSIPFRKGEHSPAIAALVESGALERRREGTAWHHWLPEDLPDRYKADPDFSTPSTVN
jgi:hypothetical protein